MYGIILWNFQKRIQNIYKFLIGQLLESIYDDENAILFVELLYLYDILNKMNFI